MFFFSWKPNQANSSILFQNVLDYIAIWKLGTLKLRNHRQECNRFCLNQYLVKKTVRIDEFSFVWFSFIFIVFNKWNRTKLTVWFAWSIYNFFFFQKITLILFIIYYYFLIYFLLSIFKLSFFFIQTISCSLIFK
jgi:hypothetical protein